MTPLPLPVFHHCAANNVNIALKFRISVGCVQLNQKYSVLWDNIKFWI